jgi:hypothetical protein
MFDHCEAPIKDRFVPWRDGHLASTVETEQDEDGLGFTVTAGGRPSKLNPEIYVGYAAKREVDFESNVNAGDSGERGPDYVGRGLKVANDEGLQVIARLHDEIHGKGR